MDRKARFHKMNMLYLLSLLSLFFFSPSAFSDAVYGLESCSKLVGTSLKDCYQDGSAAGWDDTSNGSLNGWVSSDIQGWHGNETVPYRLDISLSAAADASTYFVRVEQDNLQSGVTAVDGASAFYVGGGANSSVTEGQMTKHCTAIPGGSSLPALPFQGDECVVAGPTFTGMDDDGDGRIDEEVVNGLDDDGDGLIDEDPMPDCASSTGAQHIQYTAAIHFDPDEAGSSTSNWALYWLSHFAIASNNYPGGSVDTWLQAHRQGDGNTGNECHTPIPVPPVPADYCNGAVATIVGPSGSASIYGTSGDDVIIALGRAHVYGFAGNDTICGSDGNDLIYGGDGNDFLDGGAGKDYLYGEPGNNHLVGGDGNDMLYGDAGDDTIDGGNGDDHLYGKDGNDTLSGGDGNDKIYGEAGDDTLDGGVGADYLAGGAGADNLSGGDGNDTIYGQAGDDTLDGGAGTSDYCAGGADTDTATNCETVVQVP
jgi:Ca2+-binding RTX toxin-like protein